MTTTSVHAACPRRRKRPERPRPVPRTPLVAASNPTTQRFAGYAAVVALPTAPSSFWLDRHQALDSRTPLMGRSKQETDVVVIGAGIVGVSLARCLVNRGSRVVLLDADVAGRGATGRSAGFILAEGAETTATVTRTHGAETAQALRGAGLRTRESLAWLAGSREFGLRRTGSLRLAGDAGEAHEFEETARLLGPAVRFLAADTIPAPYRERGFTAGLVDPGDGMLDPLDLLERILSAARAQASQRIGMLHVYSGTAVSDLDEANGLVSVRSALGYVQAKRCVVTTNAWINRLVPKGPFVRPVRAQMLAARVDPVPSWDMPVYADHGTDYWRLADDGTVLLGGQRLVGGPTEETGNASPAAPVQPALDALLRRLVGEQATVRVVTRWAGTMGFSADGIPVAGKAPGYDRVWVLGGCNGHGLGWGPGLAGMLADAMAGQGSGIPACFDPGRGAVTRRS